MALDIWSDNGDRRMFKWMQLGHTQPSTAIRKPPVSCSDVAMVGHKAESSPDQDAENICLRSLKVREEGI